MSRRYRQNGFTLLEILIAVTVGAIIVTALAEVVKKMSESRTVLQEHGRLTQDARFAMDRMVRAVRGSRDLVLPQPDKPDTDWREHVREETVPGSTPEGSSAYASAVLAVSLSVSVDLDADGFPDADNDRDGLIDEDPPDDTNNDQAAGIYYIDDGGNGQTDEGNDGDNDEDGGNGEDPLNGLDDDGDGLIDEDAGADTNGDGRAGFKGVDDDGDGRVDNGNPDDDDEDGTADEDWLDTVVFYLQYDELIERHPVPWDQTASDGITGRDFIESTIAGNVSRFRVERITSSGNGEIVDITLDLTGSESGETISLNTRVRVGGAP